MDITTINPLLLPWVSLDDRRSLPDAPGIYFALDAVDTVLYIGKAKSLSDRWRYEIHHRFAQLMTIGNVRIAWITVDDAALLDLIEDACIDYFSPILNRTAVPYPVSEHPKNRVRVRFERILSLYNASRSDRGERPLSLNGFANQAGVKYQQLYRWTRNDIDSTNHDVLSGVMTALQGFRLRDETGVERPVRMDDLLEFIPDEPKAE